MKYFLGIDIGGTSIKWGIVDVNGGLLTAKKVDLPPDWPEFLNCVDEIYAEACGLYSIAGVGLSTPGIVNTCRGIITGTVAAPVAYIKDKCMFQLGARLGVPVALEQDANCAMLGEHWVGNARHCRLAMTLVLGTGLGAGVLLDGRIYRGAHMLGGDIGYACMTPRIGEQTFSWHMAPVYVENHYEQRTGRRCTIPMMYENRQTDPVAAHIYDTFLSDLANTILLLQFVLDPELFLLGGGISEWELLVPEVNRKILSLACVRETPLLPTVMACKNRNSANIVGAVYHLKTHMGL